MKRSTSKLMDRKSKRPFFARAAAAWPSPPLDNRGPRAVTPCWAPRRRGNLPSPAFSKSPFPRLWPQVTPEALP